MENILQIGGFAKLTRFVGDYEKFVVKIWWQQEEADKH